MKILLRSTLFKRLTLCIMISGRIVAVPPPTQHTPMVCAVKLWPRLCRLLGVAALHSRQLKPSITPFWEIWDHASANLLTL